MRYLVVDEDGIVMRKFWTRADADRFLQPGWAVRVLPKPVKATPTVEEYGEALW